MKHNISFEEYVNKFFTPIKSHTYKYKGEVHYSKYHRNRDEYIFSAEDVSDSLEYYNKTGIEP